MYNDAEVPPAIRYLSTEEIRWKNSESAYNPIKFEGDQFSLPTAYRRRPQLDANHSITVSDKKYRDSKAMNDYNREVSKRVRILKNKANKFFPRYEFDKRLKRLECQRNQSVEDSYKHKLSFLREKELKRGYDILTLESHFKEPIREKKVPYVKESFPEKRKTSLDGYKPNVVDSVWDKISASGSKRPPIREHIIQDLKTSHSIHGSDRMLSRRRSNDLVRSSHSIKNCMNQGESYSRNERDSKRKLRESVQNMPINYYTDAQNRNSRALNKNPMSKSLNTIEVPVSRRRQLA